MFDFYKKKQQKTKGQLTVKRLTEKAFFLSANLTTVKYDANRSVEQFLERKKDIVFCSPFSLCLG